MAKIKYNIKLWADTATNLASDTRVYEENDFIFATDSGVLKKGDGVKTYANLGTIGTVAAWKDIAGKPSTFKPSAHDHAVVADETSGLVAADTIQDLAEALSVRILEHDHAVVADETTDLEAAETLQGLAEALSARIADLDDRVALIEEEPVE